MEQLTKLNKDGEAIINFETLGTPFGKDTAYDVIDLYHIACKNLYEYEKTGLTSEEIEQLKAENVAYEKAEAEGLLFKPPCKVGDTVYVITNCENVVMDYDDDYENGTGATECPFEYNCNFEECDDGNLRIFETTCSGFWQEDCGVWKMFVDRINSDIGISDFGKTVFLTKESAEAALKGGDDK